jgi:class 3 adenylate cyclase
LASRGKAGAEELSELICDCFDGMIEDAVGRGGDVIKFGGDALLVWFEGEAHAPRAASSAIAMRRTIRRQRRTSDGRRVPLSISIGLNSGTHHFVQISNGVPDLIITGPGATATVRAESDAAPGMILMTASTAALLPASWLGDRHESGVVLRRRDPDPPSGLAPSPEW